MSDCNALADVSRLIACWRGIAADLYYCPACGYRLTDRRPRRDLIAYCWGPCLEFYGEPIPLTFVRGIGSGAPHSEMPF